ncbi:hypothetical protein TGRH88_009400 [Toxoplasma gondii]|uniref:Uncharacterized protein n=1 Tax=Toxoplasma gondii TaxID=5811 RepID=A0A7J6KCH2_TOXGO|nr:hypothetical protein TGRH88_009370 [Toxoplasma gondii]KAF4645123.1 hypothetical protein TGRH88_009400 [Toxoplasma gondii]
MSLTTLEYFRPVLLFCSESSFVGSAEGEGEVLVARADTLGWGTGICGKGSDVSGERGVPTFLIGRGTGRLESHSSQNINGRASVSLHAARGICEKGVCSPQFPDGSPDSRMAEAAMNETAEEPNEQFDRPPDQSPPFRSETGTCIDQLFRENANDLEETVVTAFPHGGRRVYEPLDKTLHAHVHLHYEEVLLATVF